MIKGFAGQEKLGPQNYGTVVPTGSQKYALDVAPKAIFPTNLTPFAVVSATYGSFDNNGLPETEQRIEITAHGARLGDVLRFDSGPLINIEASVIRVVDANNLVISLRVSNADAIASTCLVMRHVTLTLDSSGSLVTTSGPLQFIRDAVTETVEEDTADSTNNRALPTQTFLNVDGVQTPLLRDTATPANDIAMPSQMYFDRDGVPQRIIKDTAFPANTRALPVELVSTTGVEATINVTTGDLNVATTHTGANPDSMQIGDGTNIMGVNASNEALTHDADALAQLVLIEGHSNPATNGQATEAKQDAEIVLLTSIDGKDFATSAKQDTAQARLDLLATEARQITLQAKVDTLATEAKQDDVITQLTAIELNTNPSANGQATEAKQDDIITELQNISSDSTTTTEDYYRRDFNGSPLTTGSGFVTLTTLTASINKINITNNSGNELVIRNGVGGKQIIVGQGAVFSQAITGIATDVIQISAITADAIDGIIYVNFEG